MSALLNATWHQNQLLYSFIKTGFDGQSVRIFQATRSQFGHARALCVGYDMLPGASCTLHISALRSTVW